MTLDQMQVLEAIVETGSFRAAAEKLNRAQSAVSYAVKHLEDELGLLLFSRDSYRPQLTAAGSAVLRRSKSILASSRELSKMAENISRGNEPSLSVALSALVPLNPILDAFDFFSNDFPFTQLKLSVEVLGAVDRLQNGEADLGISEIEATAIDASRLEAQPLLEIGLPIVVGVAHPLAKQPEVYQSDLLNHIQIILKSTTKESVDRQAAVLQGNLIWSVSDFLTKKELLLRGKGWGFMPGHLVQKDIAAGVLRELKVPEFQNFRLPIYLLRRRGGNPGPAACKLWNIIKDRPVASPNPPIRLGEPKTN